MPKKSNSDFTVEAIRPSEIGTVALATVVLIPAKGNDRFADNRLFRVTLENLTPKAAEDYPVGKEITLSLE